MKLDDIKTLLAAVVAEHPAPWAPDGDRSDRITHVPIGYPDGDAFGLEPDRRDIIDANGATVVKRDCGMYDPHGATYRFVVHAPTIAAELVKRLELMRRLAIESVFGPLSEGAVPLTADELNELHSALGVALNEGMVSDEQKAWDLRAKVAKLWDWVNKIETHATTDLSAEIES